MYGDDIRYAKQRLEGTIIRVGEEPVTVQQMFFPGEGGRVLIAPQGEYEDIDDDEIDEDAEAFFVPEDGLMRARVVYLRDDKEEIVTIDKLNLEPVPLGYLNYSGSAYYIARKPMRNDWRQGLRTGNIAFIGAEGFYEIPKDIRNTILNIYPSLEEIKDQFKRGLVRAAAFSRDFGLTLRAGEDDYLNYKGKVIGTMNMLPNLAEQYKYLTEYLQEVLDEKRT